MTEQEYLGGLGLCKRAGVSEDELKRALDYGTTAVANAAALEQRAKRLGKTSWGSKAYDDFVNKRLESNLHALNKDYEKATESLLQAASIGNDILNEYQASKGGFMSQLGTAGGSYAGFGLGGAAAGAGLGALVAGKGRRGTGAMIGGFGGGLAGLLANYLRRKSYYGDIIKF